MRVLIARLGCLNLSKQMVYESSLVVNCSKRFLSPILATGLLIRGAKTVECGITWVKPIEPSTFSKAFSGDQECIPKIPADLVVAELRNSEILAKAPAAVKKIYSFQYQDRIRRNEMIKEALVQRVKRHDYDDYSVEVKLAKATAVIRRLQIHVETSPHDGMGKVFLKESVEKRKKKLKILRRYNYALFEWVLERLNLVYYPPPPDNIRPMRSVAMTEIATNFCENLKAARLETYRQELEKLKPDFLMRKAQTMRAIIEDEKMLKISPSFTEEEILEVERLQQEKSQELDKIPKPVKDIF